MSSTPLRDHALLSNQFMDPSPGRRKRLPRPGVRIYAQAFEKHVNNSEDVIGLIAYSFYKKAKVDWLRAYSKRTGENPVEIKIHDWTSDHLTDENIKEYRNRAFRLVEEYRKMEILKANQSQIESTHAKALEICNLADSTHKKVEILTGQKGFWANVLPTRYLSFVQSPLRVWFILACMLADWNHSSGLQTKPQKATKFAPEIRISFDKSKGL